jgi:hypothetical protein
MSEQEVTGEQGQMEMTIVGLGGGRQEAAT